MLHEFFIQVSMRINFKYLRNIKIFFSILSFNFLIFRTLYQILFYYYFNRTISRICDFVSIQMPIKCTQKKVTNHVTECSKEEIIKTIEKKKKIGQVQVPADFV